MEAGEASFFQLVELFPVQEPCRKAYRKFCFFLETANGFANLFYVAVRKGTARGHDGVTRNACGFFLLGVFNNFVGAEELVFGCAGVVVAALGAVLAVFGATPAAGVHDRAEVKVVTVEFFADFVGGIAEFLQVFTQKLDCLFAGNFVAAQYFFFKFLDKRHFLLLEHFSRANIEKICYIKKANTYSIKGEFMLKKLFLSAAVVALVFTACDSDSSTSPKNDDQPKGNSTEQSGVEQSGPTNNSTAEIKETVATDAGAEVPCSVEKLSANSFLMTMKEDGAVSRITTTIVGDQAEIDYVTEYGESVPTATIQALCESNKQEALTKNATVTCDGRTMTIHEVDGAEIGFDGALESAKQVCKSMNAYLSENSSDPEEPDQTPVSNPGASGKATCQVVENTDTFFKMVAIQPDSVTMSISMEYKDGLVVTTGEIVFEDTFAQTDVDKYCAEAKAEIAAAAEEEVELDVVCDGRKIVESYSEEYPMNILPYAVPEMKASCDEIQRTGVIPDDDEESLF